jgi:hypothetical protein
MMLSGTFSWNVDLKIRQHGCKFLIFIELFNDFDVLGKWWNMLPKSDMLICLYGHENLRTLEDFSG